MAHYDDSDTSVEKDRSKRRRKHEKSTRKDHHERRKSRKRNRRRSPSFDDESSDSSSSSDSRAKRKRRKKEKKHRKKEKRRERKESKKARRKQNNKDESGDDASSRLERNYQFTNALAALLEIQPGMASEVPIILIRMADGTSFNLDQMPDARVSDKLQQVLACLSSFGVMRDATGSWSWNAPVGGGRKDPLLLVKIARSLLDQIGLTMEAVNDYETKRAQVQAESMEQTTTETMNALQEETMLLLRKFQKDSSQGPTLAQELATLINVISSGESVSLDGLQDDALRQGIENLFRTAGLTKFEMEESDDEDGGESDDDDEVVMGYGLPDDEAGGVALTNLTRILETCKATATSTTATKRIVKGPMLPPPEGFVANDSDDDDDEGPAPIGSETARRRLQKGPSLPPDVVKAMAEKRSREMAAATGADYAAQAGEREQWMLKMEEHDLLQGIKTGNAIKSRPFENIKKRAPETAAAAPVDPSVQAEVDAIMELQREARGPSLMEQHRMKKAEEKAAAAKDGKSEWKWSRDKDLDAGRRVDKNALNMVMGGAAGNLKDKFQGGLSRGFM